MANIINNMHICGKTGGECRGFKGCGKEVAEDDTNMIGNTSFCIPCYEKEEHDTICEECQQPTVDEEDRLCHKCYHKTCAEGDCWCNCYCDD
jgi:hypothetical protein